MKKFIYILVGALISINLYAQQEVMVSQYMFNGLFLNPAYAGSHDFFEATALYRNQWVNWEGAPKTQVFGVDGPIMHNQGGVGLTVVNDEIGDVKQFEVFGNFAYHMNLDSESKNRLALGLKAGISKYTSDYTDGNEYFVDQGDPVFENNINGQWLPKFGLGVYYYNDISYIGLSVPTIYASDNKITDTFMQDPENGYFENHYFLSGGVVFKLNNDLALKPNVLIKYHPAAPLEADINANLFIKETVWVGASYRTGDAITGLLEYVIQNKIRIGYSYDFTLTDISNYSNGSHEIMLGYNFGEEVIKAKSPRYF